MSWTAQRWVIVLAAALVAAVAAAGIAVAEPPMRSAWPHSGKGGAPVAEYDPSTGRIDVSWRAVDEAAGYVAWWTNSADRFDFGQARTSETSVSLSRNSGFVDGEWKIRVRVADGGAWSKPAMVTIISAPPELVLSMESSRDLCTERTLTEIRWSADGGIGPLSLQVNGESVAELNGTIKVNCGMIPRSEDGEIDESRRDAVITGLLRDARGVVRSASIRVPRAEALPAPTEISRGEFPGRGVIMGWGRSEEGESVAGDKQEMLILMRWKEPSDADWYYSRLHSGVGSLTIHSSTDKEELIERQLLQAAELREEIESETPQALRWSSIVDHRFHRAPQNLRATTTHNTIVIEWDAQTASLSGYLYEVSVTRPQGALDTLVRADSGVPNRVVFTGMPADTEFSIQVITDRFIQVGLPSSITARTKIAPAGYIAPSRGPQNLRASTSSNSVTLRWDPPFASAAQLYTASLYDEHDKVVASETLYAKPEGGFSTTFGGLTPNSTYRAAVTHRGIVRVSAEVLIMTSESPADLADRGAPGQRGMLEIGAVVVADSWRWPGDPRTGD